MSRLVALLLDVLATEVLFCRERVVGGAAQSQIRGEVRSAPTERLDVMQLQEARLAAAPAV